jgi:CRP-like cAMP-binding protein
MSLDDDIAVLARVGLFSVLDNEALRLIAFGAESHEMAAGRLLCRAGDIADGGFVLVDGVIARLSDADDKPEYLLDKPGTLFGELSLLARTAWAASYRAEKPSRLLRVPRPLFRRIMDEFPETAATLETILTQDLAQKVRVMEQIARRFS